jgi:hypothetical protein
MGCCAIVRRQTFVKYCLACAVHADEEGAGMYATCFCCSGYLVGQRDTWLPELRVNKTSATNSLAMAGHMYNAQTNTGKEKRGLAQTPMAAKRAAAWCVRGGAHCNCTAAEECLECSRDKPVSGGSHDG